MKDTAEYFEESLLLHARYKGKLQITGKAPVMTNEDLSVIYTPGVAEPCLLIERNPKDARRYTIKGNSVAVVSDGSAVLGLGNIGGLAALPALEGKALMFREFGGIDAFPISLDTQDDDEIVFTMKNIAPAFGGICLDHIRAPRCFDIERRLSDELGIPVINDGGRGTAAVVCAAVINAFRLLKKPLYEVRATICGAGAAGNAIVKMLLNIGLRDIVVCDSKGAINVSRIHEFGEDKLELLELTNKDGLTGDLPDVIKERDLFIGVSKENALTPDMVRLMAKDPVVLALANPQLEIQPDIAKAAGASIIGTGRSDYPNHINNALIFPGLFRGVFDAEASRITDEMVLAAVHALAALVPAGKLSAEYILPSVFEEGVTEAVADAVKEAWYK